MSERCEFPRCAARAVRGAYCRLHFVRLGLAAAATARAAPYRRPAWRRLAREILDAQPWCVRCGRRARAVDHILEQRDGGTDARENLQTLCLRCHAAKTLARTRQGPPRSSHGGL